MSNLPVTIPTAKPWTATGRIDIEGQRFRGSANVLLIEEKRVHHTLSGVPRDEIRWRAATHDEASKIVQRYNRWTEEANPKPNTVIS